MTTAPAWGRPPLHPAEVGCVLGQEVGVLVVLTDAGEVRVSYGARLLGRLARDRGCAPTPGEWVRLRHWPDGPVTAEEVLAPPHEPLAPVVPLRRRAPRLG